MAHFIKIIKAKAIKIRFLHYQEEKEIGLNEDESDFEFYKERKLKKKFRKKWSAKLVKKIKTHRTIQNAVCKSFLGFTGGIILTYIFFLFFHIAVNFSLEISTYMFALAGSILCLGLAFSSKVRCYVLLLLPVFFSKQGRQALLAYALFLAFTGPARNTMHNMEILSESMTCGQEMDKRTLIQTIEIVNTPCRSVNQTLQKLKETLKKVVNPIKTFEMKIKRIILSILTVIKMANTWLESIVNLCNKKVGTPFQRCMKTFDDAIADCKAKLGVLDFLCHVVHIVKALCYTVKWLDFICLFRDCVSRNVIEVVKKKLTEFGLRIENSLYVSIECSNSYKFDTTASNSTKKMAKTILQRISKKVERLQNIFSFCGFIFSLFVIIVFFKVYYYKYKFLSSDKYDNIYISKYIVELDIKRAQMDRDTVLPLEPREKKKYGESTAVRLLQDEKTRIRQSMFLLGLTSFKILVFIIVDYSLFWTLMVVYEAGHNALKEVEKSKVSIHIEENTFLANFYRNLGDLIQVPENVDFHLNPIHCLPDPVRPDTGRYIQIGVLVALCWILTLFEAYGLRMRNVVMSLYYPDRTRERALWLYNDILRHRGTFLLYSRRQLRKKFGAGKPLKQETLCQRLFANFPILRSIFRRKNENNCLLCEASETKSKPLKRCKTPDCYGRYCLSCFVNLENICTICQHPIDYGDISDISEEVDSSEEDLYKKYGSDNNSVVTQKSEKFLTFKDMEFRDQFRDVEANRVPDYAKLSDLYNSKTALRRRLKEVLQKEIEFTEWKRNRKLQIKVAEYRKIKSKLESLLSTLKKRKQKKVTAKKSALKKKLEEKISKLEKYKGNQGDESEKLIGETSTPTKSKVSFKLEEDTEAKKDFGTLKNKIKAKLQKNKTKNF